MPKAPKTIFTDGAVLTQILDIIRDAKKDVVLVTPYVGLEGIGERVKQALSLAVKNGRKITVIVRSNNVNPLPEKNASIKWLIEHGISVSALENLHAKIYLNEEYVVLSSMNLLQSSMEKSHEIAIVIKDDQVEQYIRNYVSEELMSRATSLNPGTPVPFVPPLPKARQPAIQASTGTCIRCGNPVPLDPSRPLCKEDYEVWAEYENEDYPENFCHACGKPAKVSHGKPLCPSCFRQQR